ncbi:MAG: hypothetical protein ACXWTY_00830 [Methylobacter sp.]
MLKGSLHLTLLMGPVVPVPAPKIVVDALTEITVTNAVGSASGFELKFSLSNDSVFTSLMLLLGQVGPLLRTIIIVTVKGMPEVLIDGVVTQHQVTPDVQTGRSALTLTGSDLTAVLDFIDFSGIPYPAMPPEARVALIIAKYAVFGLIPVVVPRIMFEVPNPLNRIHSHKGKDLAYINLLAEEAGYTFFIEPGPAPGTNFAYWGPEFRISAPQPALNINMDVHTNVESLNLRFDASKATLPLVFIQIEELKLTLPVPLPGLNPLAPPLGVIPPVSINVEQLKSIAHLSIPQAIMRGLKRAADSTSEAVIANGSLDVLRYGHILKARRLVGVRGAGQIYDGLYFVKSVTHKIQRGEYKQDFTLTRNGLISTVPVVPV